MNLEQYQIVLVNLGPTIGSEITKIRPCVIISPNEINKFLRTVIVAPMTTRSRSYPTRVHIKQHGEPGWIVIDQLWTIDKRRIIKVLGNLRSDEIVRTKEVIKETLVD